MRFVLSLCVVALLLTGCRKKSSPEFYKLEGAQDVLIDQRGDDAYVAPEMASIIAGLAAVPDDALEKPRAQALVTKLVAGAARVKAERTEPPKLPAVDPFPGLAPYVAPVDPPPPAPVEEVVDAGEAEPWAGMDEATFAKRYGTCFSKGPNTEVSRGVPATSQVLASSVDCQKRLGTPRGTTSYLFVDGGVWGKVVATYALLDAGARPQPPPPPAAPPDAGEVFLTIPGAPLPEGYPKTTVY